MRQEILDRLRREYRAVEVSVNAETLRPEAQRFGIHLTTKDGKGIALGAHPQFENPQGFLVWFPVLDDKIPSTPSEKDRDLVARAGTS